MYEPVARIAAALDEIAARTGVDVPIHVDGASGGMVAPFLQPDLDWDFRVPRVVSINTSGHKYGLVYPGLGWIVWRDQECVPHDLIFDVSYLGGDMPTLALNFSRPGAQVLLQYYMFLRLGFDGYRAVQQATQDVARYLAGEIARIPALQLWNDGSDIPVFAWRQRPGHTENWNLYHLSDKLRMKGWLVPAYPLPADMADVTVQRVVVRNGLSHDLAEALADDIREAVEYLERITSPMPPAHEQPGFHH
jgi:glutamate decarboxylase